MLWWSGVIITDRLRQAHCFQEFVKIDYRIQCRQGLKIPHVDFWRNCKSDKLLEEFLADSDFRCCYRIKSPSLACTRSNVCTPETSQRLPVCPFSFLSSRSVGCGIGHHEKNRSGDSGGRAFGLCNIDTDSAIRGKHVQLSRRTYRHEPQLPGGLGFSGVSPGLQWFRSDVINQK